MELRLLYRHKAMVPCLRQTQGKTYSLRCKFRRKLLPSTPTEEYSTISISV
jgi:hypothetical protein